MTTLFDFAERCLFNPDIDQKLALTHQAQQLFIGNGLSIDESVPVQPIEDTRFPSKPQLLQPRDMPRRRMDTVAGQAAFFHAMAHIEFMAIYLAWDIIYRFRGLPTSFYADWLKIADEEAQHFSLLNRQLQSLGYNYGDLPAHQGLWLHAIDTADDVLARLAVVPRYMEARGLDVTPAMIEKFQAAADTTSAAILIRIYEDEIGHVERGSFWFSQLAKQHGLEPETHFKYLLSKHFRGKPKGPFNREARIIAGFTHHEIDWLEEKSHE